MAPIYNRLKEDPYLWDLFTRKEEYCPKNLDEHGRFIYANSSYRDIMDPRVSTYLADLTSKVEYPDDKSLAICLTHDIDDIYPPLSHRVLSSLYLLKEARPGEACRQLMGLYGFEESPYLNFEEVIDLEREFGAKSSFYFITADRDIRRFRYDIEDLEGEIGLILDNGCEVGLHGGYYAYNDLGEMKKEKRRLEKVAGKEVIGYRNHYLRLKVPDTWELLSKAGFRYDSSLGYSDAVGFRNGMCHPFEPYNLKSNKGMGLLEINLNIMDSALFGMARSFKDAWDITRTLIQVTMRYRGVLTLLWHNTAFNCPFREDRARFYRKLLAHCAGINAWMTSGEDIWRWWMENDYL